MTTRRFTLIFLTALSCSLVLAGCDRSKEDKALVEAAETRATVANTLLSLAKSEKENEHLKSELAAAIQGREELQAAADESTNIKKQLAELAKERDAALTKAIDAQAMIEKLKSQLQQQIQQSTGLQDQNKKLQATIDELQKKSAN
jgi:cell shape-determining protein MreC